MVQRPVHEIEKKWQDVWEALEIYRAAQTNEKQPYYGLIEFPFPSGDGLHVGHLRPFTAIDVFTRKKRMQGFDVLYPIGWDAFGLPTENYAIKNKVRPQDATAKNVANFTRQAKSLGLGFDWSREVNTTDPAYFKWTQWQFLQFVKHGMAYKALSEINWCPKCKIGLANEEAQGGVCERCGTPVEKRQKSQWMINITSYAERLLNDLEKVDYLEKIKAQQRHWIGKSEGATIRFATEQGAVIEVFTTRPDTLFGVTYVVLAPEHALVNELTTAEQKQAVQAYREAASRTTDEQRTNESRPKTGVFTGSCAINPATQERVPVWIADYVLASYGTGAVMAVPAHDERDFAFAKTYQLPMKPVIAKHFIEPANPPREGVKTVRRKTAHAIVTRKHDGAVLMLKWNANQRADGSFPMTFVIGGVEEGENIQEAMQREILEETGLKHVQFVQQLPIAVQTEYFAGHKGENRIADITVMQFEAEGDEAFSFSEEERAKQEPIWVPKEDVAEAVNVCDGPYIWGQFLHPSAMTEDGLVCYSDFLNGFSTAQAKSAIIEWLEKTNNGRRTVTYKLRDWVFSRQRYWGEPIPLVKCEACATKKQKVVLLHGFGGSPSKNWLPWLKQSLEQEGFEVSAPALPDSRHPVSEAWIDAIVKELETLGEDDIVIAHSLGAQALLKAIPVAKKKIGHVLLVAPAIGSVSEAEWNAWTQENPLADFAALRAFWTGSIDWKNVDGYVKSGAILSSDDDFIIRPATFEGVPRGWFCESWKDFGHFDGAVIPELFERVKLYKNTGWVPVPDSQLPLELPPIEAYTPSDDGESPLAKMPEWFNTTCPRCGGPAVRETDTMPNWAGSSWYFLRYADPHNTNEFASEEALKHWMPVDLYNGGMEHTTLHLLYSRFWHKFLFDLGYIPQECGDEPYSARRSQGLILGPDGEKMSKSRGNVVNPDDLVKEFGADVVRTYIMFMGPFDQPVPWDMNGIQGVRKFLDRVWNAFQLPNETATPEVERVYHQTIKKITDGIERMEFNTCVSQLMICTNAVLEADGWTRDMREGFAKALAPFAPHLAEELWQNLAHKPSVHVATWPSYDEHKLIADTYELAVQVNGKVRGKIVVPQEATEEEVVALAKKEESVARWLTNEPKKAIFVKGRLLSLIV